VCMRDYDLDQAALAELRAVHRSARMFPSYLSYRLHAIILLGSGFPPSEVSNILMLSEDTVVTYFDKYQSGGISKLLKREYKGSNKKLSKEEIALLTEELDSSIYLTTKSVCHFVKSEFDIEYSERGMSSLLKSIGYVYKKPDIVPGESSEELQDIFIEQFVNFLKTKSDKDVIYFADAVHPVHNTQPGYGWIRKGEKRTIKSNTGRNRYNIHGAMNAETYHVTAVFSEDNINATTTIDLFKALEKSHPEAKVIHVVLDNARYHFSHTVLDYAKKSKVNLVPLPPYSPELNLIERFWKHFKKKVIYNSYYLTFDDFKKACLDFFKNQHSYYDETLSIMGDGIEALLHH